MPIQCRLDTKADGGVADPAARLRDGFHGSTVITASGAVLEIGAQQTVRRVDVVAGAGEQGVVVDASLGWEHSLFVVAAVDAAQPSV